LAGPSAASGSAAYNTWWQVVVGGVFGVGQEAGEILPRCSSGSRWQALGEIESEQTGDFVLRGAMRANSFNKLRKASCLPQASWIVQARRYSSEFFRALAGHRFR